MNNTTQSERCRIFHNRTYDVGQLLPLNKHCITIISKKADDGHILENIVYLELLRRGYDVYIGKVGNAEVDFIAVGEEGEEYYQVAYTVIDADGKTLNRELSPLNAIKDHNPKYLLTMDYGPMVSHNGIKQINVLEWLIKK